MQPPPLSEISNGLSSAAPNTISCDIFCTVVDNFGDAGVCWRLARQLANQRGWQVRLLIDQPAVLASMLPALAPLWAAREASNTTETPATATTSGAVGAAQQTAPVTAAPPAIRIDAVLIDTWSAATRPKPIGSAAVENTAAEASAQLPENAPVDVADVVIEAFACELPPTYLAAMARRAKPPVWINFDYLSAEDWVADFHLLPSPHPRLPLLKTFFFPGLTTGTGGLLRENDLSAQRRAFLTDADAQQALLEKLGVATMPAPGTARITLFAYENPAIAPLLQQWTDSPRPIALFVPAGRISPQVAHHFGKTDLKPGTHVRSGQLTVHSIPFMSQRDYDRLLWLSDLNFVRGEDSFVRAQWAEKPFVWQIYPQSDDVHLEKLDAALMHYIAALPAPTQAAVKRFWHAWNDGKTAVDWQDYWQHADQLTDHGTQWAHTLHEAGSLSENLADFVESQLK